MKKKMLVSILFLMVSATLILGGCSRGNRRGQSLSDDSEVALSTEETSGENSLQDQTPKEPGISTKEKLDPIDWSSGEEPSLEQLKAAAKNYYFSTGDEDSTTINGLGKVIKAEDINVKVLEDTITHEVRYYVAYYCKYKTKETEYGLDYDSTMFSKVYDNQGKVVADWREIVYSDGVGDWLMEQEYSNLMFAEETSKDPNLRNLKTGKVLEEIQSVMRLSDEYVFVNRANSGMYYVLDKEGNIFYDSKNIQKELGDTANAYCIDNCVIVKDSENEFCNLYFYEPDGKKLGYISNVYYSTIYDDIVKVPYVVCENAVYDLREGNGGELSPIFSQDETTYYDGSLAICRVEDATYYSMDYLYDVKAQKVLTDKYLGLGVVERYYLQDTITEDDYFYGYTLDKVDKIDRTGKVVASIDIKNISSISIYSDCVAIYSDDYSTTTYLDNDLKEFCYDKYEYMSPLFKYVGGKCISSGLWAGHYYLDADKYIERNDILTKDGKIIVSGVADIGTINEDAFAVTRGLQLGIMDYDGNWIYKLEKNELYNGD